MLSFKSYLPDDKGFGYLPHDEDLFEQYLNQDPIEFGDPIDGSDGFQAFEFAFDEETESSESCSADSNKQVGSQPTQHPAQSTLDFEPAQAPLPLRTRPQLISRDAPGRAISGSELLNLEGKSGVGVHHTRVKSLVSSSAATPTLRRKGKFCAPAQEILRGRTQKISKTPSAEMIRPSNRHESPSYHEWTQRFEQFSIQTPVTAAQSSPSRDTETYRDKRPSKILTSFDHDHQQRQVQAHLPTDASNQPQRLQNNHFNGAATALLPQDWQNHGNPQPSPITNAEYEYEDKPLERSQTQQLRHPPSWGYGPVSPLTPDFAVSAGHVQPSWLHNLPENNIDSYFENNAAIPPSAPSFPETNENFTAPGLSFQYGAFDHFVNEDPSQDYTVHAPDNFFALSTNHHETTRGGVISNHTQPQTPASRSLSVSPPLHSPSKSRLRSKSHRRQKSMGALKSPKSAGALKGQRSAKDLRSPKSTGTFGFVNFTEADKGKILTGVAPSGSSKTKARRELEAADKKRRLSQAALRAIEEAGGDIEVLKRVEEFEY